jgi:hypothetical protein
MLHCGRPVVTTLRFRPPGHALHEGTFLYAVCGEHADKYRGEPGYTEVRWDTASMTHVAVTA